MRLNIRGGVDNNIVIARNQMKDQFASNKNVLNILYNNPDGQNLTAKVASSIDDRANLFGAQNSYYQALGIPVKWFGSAEKVSRRLGSGLGADGSLSYVTFFGGKFFLGENLYNWRSEAGNALIKSGFGNFKDLFNNPYQNPIDWDIKQLKNEQQTLQPIHEKYLGGHSIFNWVSTWWTQKFDDKGIPEVNLVDYKSRIEYGCSLMGYGKNQGCKP